MWGNLEWNKAFLACAAAFFLAGVSALGINATIPIVRDEPHVVA